MKSVITSAQVQFEILVGAYFTPESGSGQYCEMGVRNMKLSVSSVKDRVLRLASYLSSKGMQYVGIAYELWRQSYKHLVSWDKFSKLF
jgi:hypothetical protein